MLDLINYLGQCEMYNEDSAHDGRFSYTDKCEMHNDDGDLKFKIYKCHKYEAYWGDRFKQ